MTVYEEVETRRPSVGTKVLVLACAILAVLGSFWAIVWFIRAYVEPPRVMRPAPMALAASESTPVVTPARASESTPTPTPARASGPDGGSVSVTQTQAASGQPVRPATAQFNPRQAEQPASDPLADRWAPINQLAPPPAMAAPPAPEPIASEPSPNAAAAPQADPDEVVEASVPAIEGPAPLPRRRPLVTAAARRTETPLPRPRPEAAGAAQPPSAWIAVPTADDRYPGQ